MRVIKVTATGYTERAVTHHCTTLKIWHWDDRRGHAQSEQGRWSNKKIKNKTLLGGGGGRSNGHFMSCGTRGGACQMFDISSGLKLMKLVKFELLGVKLYVN